MTSHISFVEVLPDWEEAGRIDGIILLMNVSR
jgi:hypothetical protein